MDQAQLAASYQEMYDNVVDCAFLLTKIPEDTYPEGLAVQLGRTLLLLANEWEKFEVAHMVPNTRELLRRVLQMSYDISVTLMKEGVV